MVKFEVRFIIEVAGKPVENVQKALEKVQEQLEGSDKFKLVDCSLEKPVLNEENSLFSGFLDVEAKFKSASDLLGFIVDYTPTSIEIIEPEKVSFDSSDFAGLLNDVSSFMLASSMEKRKLQIAANQMFAELQQLKNNK